MDGTMTVSNIDFKRMRERTGILEGDLFTVMDSWANPERVDAAHRVILEMEAHACLSLELQPGLLELLQLLEWRGTKVALVTRNTSASVDCFFQKAGERWRELFSIVLTREFRYVKPDKRLLLHVAEGWGVAPADMLMVGDSREDVECGKAAGTATCLIAGGGNEVAAPATQVSSVEPTFLVQSLQQLQHILTSSGQSVGSSEEVGRAAAEEYATPASLGLRFVDRLLASGVIKAASCSFPRLAGAFGGATASTRPGDRVLHLGCGDGSLSKLLASQGMRLEGADLDPAAVAAASSRGLRVHLLRPGDRMLPPAAEQQVDVVLSFTQQPEGGVAPPSLDPATAAAAADGYVRALFPWGGRHDVDAIWKALVLGGRFAAGHVFIREVAEGKLSLSSAADALDAYALAFQARGFTITQQAVERCSEGVMTTLVATKPGLFQFYRS